MKIAFVCLHGSAKSLVAARYLNLRATGNGLDVHAFSAGIEPDATVPPHVVEGLREKGIDVSGHAPPRLGKALLAGADRVIGFGHDLGDAVAPTCIVEHWSDCPAVSDGFDAAWQYITRRVDLLLRDSGR